MTSFVDAHFDCFSSVLKVDADAPLTMSALDELRHVSAVLANLSYSGSASQSKVHSTRANYFYRCAEVRRVSI